ncbi:hypothetical protein [Chitinophaga sp.]|uniref:OmpP1/FadL family transporter n=1 Tax=Chitinophaga sp. TaxID=1869181 RepID=UPI0026346413|nr:hypothetical protein [uncultured Chitinophaga sp.]
MNKRTAFLLIALGVSATAMAQDEHDALRYSRLLYGGTARTQAIGGAAGSLGGDISATHINPAGLGFFKTSEANITPGFYFKNTEYDFLGNKGTDNKSGASLGNIGVVFGIPNRSSASKFRNFAIAVDYARTADFNNRSYMSGTNSLTSFSDRWVEQLQPGGNPVPFDDATGAFVEGASLGFNTYLLGYDPDNNNGVERYYTVVNPTAPGGIGQMDEFRERGGINEFSLGFGGNYNEQFYFGLSLNFPRIDYERDRTFTEKDQSNLNNDFESFAYTESLSTDANGFNAKLGIIYAPMPSLRIGANFHTPTWFSMHDAMTARVDTRLEELGSHFQRTEDLTDGFPLEYDYTLKTPWRAGGSVSYIFGTNADVKQQHGFITADVEYVDYASTQYRFNKGSADDRQAADARNRVIENAYTGAVNVRLGGELKFNVLAVRAGFSYYGNPYSSDFSDVDGSIKRVSGGLGYRNRGFFSDLTYVHTLNSKTTYNPYVLNESEYAAPVATGNLSGGNIVLTVGFKF